MNDPHPPRGRTLRRRLTVGAGLATVAVAIGVTTAAASSPGSTSTTAPGSPPTTASTPTAAAPFIVQDISTGSHLEIVIDPSDSKLGQFTAAIPGLGLVWTSTPATVTAHSSHSVAVRYDGTGSLDAHAHLDAEFGSDYKASGAAAAAQVRLIGQLDPDHKTASVELWVNNVHYHLAATPATSGAAPVMASVVADLNANDFASLYNLTDAQMHGATESQYAALGASNGKFSAVHTVGTVTYKTSDSGLQAAEQAVTATTTRSDGSTHTLNGTVELIGTQQGWKLYSINPAP